MKLINQIMANYTEIYCIAYTAVIFPLVGTNGKVKTFVWAICVRYGLYEHCQNFCFRHAVRAPQLTCDCVVTHNAYDFIVQ